MTPMKSRMTQISLMLYASSMVAMQGAVITSSDAISTVKQKLELTRKSNHQNLPFRKKTRDEKAKRR